jgi:hypothetical protein
MYSLETIFLLIFVFSVLTVTRTLFIIIRALLQETPDKFVWSNGGLVFLGISLSYIITYIIQK